MKKTINLIARALPCSFFWRNVMFTKYQLLLNLCKSENLSMTFLNDNNPVRTLASLAKREILLEMLNRKKSILLILFSLISFSSMAQDQNVKLSLGDKIIDVSFSQILNYKDTATQLSQLRGKPMILDFWATYCSACITQLPKMDSLQKQFDKNLQIFLVNAYVNDKRDILINFIQQEKEKISGFRLPIVQSTEKLRAIFPVKSMPHYIWVGSDGRIKAVTGPTQITATNIKLLIAGLTLNVKNKNE